MGDFDCGGCDCDFDCGDCDCSCDNCDCSFDGCCDCLDCSDACGDCVRCGDCFKCDGCFAADMDNTIWWWWCFIPGVVQNTSSSPNTRTGRNPDCSTCFSCCWPSSDDESRKKSTEISEKTTENFTKNGADQIQTSPPKFQVLDKSKLYEEPPKKYEQFNVPTRDVGLDCR